MTSPLERKRSIQIHTLPSDQLFQAQGRLAARFSFSLGEPIYVLERENVDIAKFRHNAIWRQWKVIFHKRIVRERVGDAEGVFLKVERCQLVGRDGLLVPAGHVERFFGPSPTL